MRYLKITHLIVLLWDKSASSLLRMRLFPLENMITLMRENSCVIAICTTT